MYSKWSFNTRSVISVPLPQQITLVRYTIYKSNKRHAGSKDFSPCAYSKASKIFTILSITCSRLTICVAVSNRFMQAFTTLVIKSEEIHVNCIFTTESEELGVFLHVSELHG